MNRTLLAVVFVSGVVVVAPWSAFAACTPGSCNNACFGGSYAFSNISEGKDGSVTVRRGEVGVLQPDGNGHLGGSIKATALNSSGLVEAISISICAEDSTYEIRPDCTGTVTVVVEPCEDPPGGPSVNEIVLDDSGKGLRGLKVTGNGVVLGTGRTQ